MLEGVAQLRRQHAFLSTCRQRQHVGFIDDSHQPSISANRLIVSTRDSVVASLDLSSRKLGKCLLPGYFIFPHRKTALLTNYTRDERREI